jgi:hypothetical protein
MSFGFGKRAVRPSLLRLLAGVVALTGAFLLATHSRAGAHPQRRVRATCVAKATVELRPNRGIFGRASFGCDDVERHAVIKASLFRNGRTEAVSQGVVPYMTPNNYYHVDARARHCIYRASYTVHAYAWVGGRAYSATSTRYEFRC